MSALKKASKDKLRRERLKEFNANSRLEEAFKERDGPYEQPPKTQFNFNEHIGPIIEVDELIEDNSSHRDYNDAAEADENKNKGLIQLNNVCFELRCNKNTMMHGRGDADELSITAAKGSICVANSRYSMIGKISKALGFKVVKETKLWNILWTDSLPGVELYKNMKRFQQINHFPGMMEICRKDLLSRNLNRMLKLFPHEYRIFPKTWIFPADYGDALAFANNHTKTRTFILKPDAGAQGRGIWLTCDLKSINPGDRMICQTYISKPLLIDGYKFDLRVYTLITSVDPLRIFVYNEGLARFATNKYVEPSSDNSNDLFMHLTNYSVNKRSSQYELCDNDDCGSKRKFSAINKWMRRRGHNVDEFWSNIDDIIIKTVLSAWPMLKHNYHACFPGHDKIQACFEILGFDVLVDSKLKPYILEVNHSPSFHTQEQVDKEVKKPLIMDTLKLVSTVLADKRQIMREDRKRVKARLLKVRQGDLTSKAQPGAVTAATDNQQTTTTTGFPLSPLAQQIAWEESHLGDFRRIMPPHDPAKQNYYGQFFALQNQASIYSETAASKKREEVAKKLRMQLEEKRARQQEMINSGGRIRAEERRRKRANMSRAALERNRQNNVKSQANWVPTYISEAEERLRRTWMQMRSDLCKSERVVEVIYCHLYSNGNLSNADIIQYPDLYRSLENGFDIISET